MATTRPDNVIPISLSGLKEACSQCNLRELCLPYGLDAGEIKQLDNLVINSRPLAKGDHLYRAGDHFTALFVIKTGFLKTAILGEDGREQVTGFHMGGEIVGLDGIDGDRHNCSALALERSTVCQVPFSRLEELSGSVPALQRQFSRIMSREIVRDQGVMMLLGTMLAEQRLVAFLLNLSQRLATRGASHLEFQLRMTREDIGSYLGMKLETVSRAFSHLQDQGLIAVNSRQLQLLDVAGLKSMVSSPLPPTSPKERVKTGAAKPVKRGKTG